MISFKNEKGKGALQTIIVIIVLFVAIYLMVKFFPSIHKSYNFRETIKKEARGARSRPGYEEIIVNNLLRKANELELDINKSNIMVRIERGFVTIEVDYYIEITTPFYTFKRHFTEKAENPLFM